MKKNYFYIWLFAILSGTCLVGCDDDVHPVINEGDISGFITDIQDTTLSMSDHALEIRISPAVKYKELLTDTGWGVQDIYIWNNEIGGYDFSKSITETELDWAELKKIQKEGKTLLQVIVKENETSEKRGASICIGQKIQGVNYLGVVNIMQRGREENAPFEVRVRYKGEIRTSMATLDEEGLLEYEDKNFATFMDGLSQRNDIEAVVRENGVIDYYDSQDVEAVAAIRKMMQPAKQSSSVEPRWSSFATRGDANAFRFMASGALAYAAMYDDKGYKDTYFYRNFTDLTDYYDQQDMKNIGLNDKTTSLAVAYNGSDSTLCAVLTVWEDTDYNSGDNNRTKHRMSFVASYHNPQMGWRNLKNIPCLTGRDTWNDRISSISFHFGYYGHYLRNY